MRVTGMLVLAGASVAAACGVLSPAEGLLVAALAHGGGVALAALVAWAGYALGDVVSVVLLRHGVARRLPDRWRRRVLAAMGDRAVRRRVLTVVALAALLACVVLIVVPRVGGLRETWERLAHGDPAWLMLAGALEALSYVAYVVLFRAVLARDRARIGWRASYQITMAGVVASRVLAAAGAGGIALTGWALRASGLEARTVGRQLVAFLVLLYSVYMAALVVGALASGLLPGAAPLALTLAPAALAGAIIAGALVLGHHRDASEPGALVLGHHCGAPEPGALVLGRAQGGSEPRRAIPPAGGQRVVGSRARVVAVPRAGVGDRWRSRARGTPSSSARSGGGASTSQCCGRACTHSASHRRPPWS